MWFSEIHVLWRLHRGMNVSLVERKHIGHAFAHSNIFFTFISLKFSPCALIPSLQTWAQFLYLLCSLEIECCLLSRLLCWSPIHLTVVDFLLRKHLTSYCHSSYVVVIANHPIENNFNEFPKTITKLSSSTSNTFSSQLLYLFEWERKMIDAFNTMSPSSQTCRNYRNAWKMYEINSCSKF